MFIGWGRKVVKKRLGWVADFCLVCRDYRRFQASRIVAFRHVCSIPLGSRTTVGHARTCESCSCTVEMQPQVYRSFSRDRQAGLNDLIRKTHPRILEHSCDRLQLEDRAREGLLSADERRDFILEPFVLLNQRVEEREARQVLDWYVGLGLAAAVVSIGYGISFVGYRNPGPSDVPAEVVFGAVVASFMLLIHAMDSRVERFTRARILPVIAQSLRGCSPTAEELEEAVYQLRQLRTPIGRALRIKDVHGSFGIGRSAKLARQRGT